MDLLAQMALFFISICFIFMKLKENILLNHQDVNENKSLPPLCIRLLRTFSADHHLIKETVLNLGLEFGTRNNDHLFVWTPSRHAGAAWG